MRHVLLVAALIWVVIPPSTSHAQISPEVMSCVNACNGEIDGVCHDDFAITQCVMQQPTCSHNEVNARIALAVLFARRSGLSCEGAPAPGRGAAAGRGTSGGGSHGSGRGTPVTRAAPAPAQDPRFDALNEQLQRLAADIERLNGEIAALRGERTEAGGAEPPAEAPAPPSDDGELAALRAELERQNAELRRTIDELRVLLAARSVPPAEATGVPADPPQEREREGAPRAEPEEPVAPPSESETSPERPEIWDRFGGFFDLGFRTSRYYLLDDPDSSVPKTFLIGVGLTLRVVPRVYLYGGVSIGIGTPDVNEVPAQFTATYRFGVMGVAREHLLVLAGFNRLDRFSGTPELRETFGIPIVQLNQRGGELGIGYIRSRKGWSPFAHVSLLLLQGRHADWRPTSGVLPHYAHVGFEPGVMINVGVANLGR